jgi:PAS domain S-box-containing protein/putative nucleotidyltransferase with HDIG domain
MGMKPNRLSTALRIALLYLFFGAAWVLVTDHLLIRMLDDPIAITRLQTYKGWAFVVASAALIFTLLRRHLRLLQGGDLALRESEARYRSLVQVSPEAVFINRGDRIVFINQAGLKMFGAEHPDQVLGRSPLDFFHPDYHPLIRERIHRMREGKQAVPLIEEKIVRLDGSLLDVEVVAAPLEEQGETAIQVILRDISERKRGQELLAFQAHLLQAVGSAVIATDLDGRVTYWNRAAEQLYGWSSAEALGRPVTELTPAEQSREQSSEIMEQLTAGQSWSGEFLVRRKDGTEFPAYVITAPITDAGGNLAGVIGVSTDLSEIKEAQARVHLVERRAQALLEKAPDGIVLIGPDGTMAFASPSAKRLFGYEGIDEAGMDPAEHTHSDDLPIVLTALAELGQNPALTPTLQYRFRHADGSWRWVESTFTNLLADESVNAIVINFRDITERRRAERRIERQVRRLHALREVDRVITSSFSLHLNLEQIVTHAVEQLEVDAAGILLFNQDLNRLEYAAGRGFRSPAIARLHPGIREGLFEHVILRRELIHLPDLQAQPIPGERGALLAAEGFATYFCIPLLAKGRVQGVLEIFHRLPLTPDADWLDFLNTLAGQTAIAIESTTTFEQLQVLNAELFMAYDATIEGWSRAMDLRDKETEGHTQRVTTMTLALARQLGVPEDEQPHYRRGALLHDIGKMGVPDHILLKEGTLTDEEWVLMRQHPAHARQMLASIRYLEGAAQDIPYYHHEKWDGSGYPNGLQGEDIPLAARIFAVVDVWDALNSDRPYRPAWERKKIIAHLRQ